MTVTPDRMTFILELMGLLVIAIVVLAICATVIAVTALRKAERGAPRVLALVADRAGFLQILTVATIVQTVLVLRVFEALSADATISVLSGIAGYVLGNLTRPQPNVGQQDPRPASG